MPNLNKKATISILGLIILAIGAIFLLNYFHLTVQVVPADSSGKQNMAQIGEVVANFWNTYVLHFWNDVWVPYFWKPFLSGMQNSNSLLNGNSSNQINFH